jgi:sec-independent protein translocase protein TatC
MLLVMILLARLGLVMYTMMLNYWRYALVCCFIIGALLTPPDVISQVLLAGPMMVLYFISVGCAFFFAPAKKEEEGEQA